MNTMLELPILIPLLLTAILLAVIGLCICYQCIPKRQPRSLPRSNVAEASNSTELESNDSLYDDSILHEPVFELPRLFHPEPPPTYEEALNMNLNVRYRNSKDILNVENVTFEKGLEAVSSREFGGETATDKV